MDQCRDESEGVCSHPDEHKHGMPDGDPGALKTLETHGTPSE